MSGYYGYSMSNNAVAAYEDGEMPISKWTKSAILAAAREIDAEKADMLRRIPLFALKKHFLICTSWHHTSLMYNPTDFYSIDEAAIESLTPEIAEQYRNEKKEAIEVERFRGDLYYL